MLHTRLARPGLQWRAPSWTIGLSPAEICVRRSVAVEDAIQLYRMLLGNRAYVRSLSEGAAFLAASAIAIFASVTYATVHASNYVTDFVLSRVGPYNVRFLFIYGTFAAFAVTAGLLAWRPNRLPFALKATALFLLVRAVFVALTH